MLATRKKMTVPLYRRYAPEVVAMERDVTSLTCMRMCREIPGCLMFSYTDEEGCQVTDANQMIQGNDTEKTAYYLF